MKLHIRHFTKRGTGMMWLNPDKEYMESNAWKCEKSPTGAHYWVEGLNVHGIFTCKWCAQHRRFPHRPSEPAKEMPS